MLSKDSLKVEVLVLNYNGKHYLKECLNSLRKQSYKNYDVYIIDNGSTDNSVEYVKEYFPWVKVIAFKDNLGFSKAYNEAIKMLDTDFVALLNNDTRVENSWLSELVNSIPKDESIIIAGSKILLYDNPRLLNHAGSKITPIGGGFNVGLYEEDRMDYNTKKYDGAACGAAMLICRDKFLEIGGFDDDFFAYFEDVDLCWRAWLYGYKVLYVPKSVVYHKLGGSWGRSSPKKVFLGERNRLLSMIKNFECRNLIRGLLLHIPYNIIKIMMYARNGISDRIFSMFKANLWVLINMGKIICKRKIIQEKRVINDNTLFELGIIASISESIREFLRLNL